MTKYFFIESNIKVAMSKYYAPTLLIVGFQSMKAFNLKQTCYYEY